MSAELRMLHGRRARGMVSDALSTIDLAMRASSSCRPPTGLTCSTLRFCAPVTHRTKKVRIDTCQASQSPRVQPVILARALPDQTHVPRVGHDHFVPEPL